MTEKSEMILNPSTLCKVFLLMKNGFDVFSEDMV